MGFGSAPTLDATGEALLSRHKAWWRREGMLYAEPSVAPLGRLWLPLTDGTVATEDVDLTPERVDIERIVGEPLGDGSIETVGDQFCRSEPYTPIPWVEAILGLPIRTTIEGGSMRVSAHIPDWSAWESGQIQRNEEWFDLLKRLVSLLVERRSGRHAINQTLMRGPSDLAEAVLGPVLMCFSIYDHPKALHRFLDQVTDLFIEILHEQLALIPAIEGGYVCPFGIWSPGTVVRTQCDASAFLSPDQYAEWFMPYDIRICESVDFSIIHLHSNSLHTVDKLLGLDRPHAIQVTLDIQPSGPPLVQILPVLRRILSVKPLILVGYITDEEMRILGGELPTDGLSVTRRLTTF